jgi:hypothetical protein
LLYCFTFFQVIDIVDGEYTLNMFPRDYGHRSRNSMVAAVIWLTATNICFTDENGDIPSSTGVDMIGTAGVL